MQTNQYQRHSLANNQQGDASQDRCRMVWNKYLIQQYQIFDAVFTTKYLRTVFMLDSSNAVLAKLHLSGVTWNPGITAKWKQLASGFFFYQNFQRELNILNVWHTKCVYDFYLTFMTQLKAWLGYVFKDKTWRFASVSHLVIGVDLCWELFRV